MVLVKVTEEHIKNGLLRSSIYCPVALAIKEILNRIDNGKKAFTGVFVCIIYDEEHTSRTTYLPNEASDWIKKHDRREKVEPFEFELDFSK